jgi:hypothetical protein
VAEAELEGDVPTSLRAIYYWSSGEAQKAKAKIENPTVPGLLDRLVDPNPFPVWLTEIDLDYFASQFRNSGFRGSLNRYRNSERDFEQLTAFDGKPIMHPTAFMAGSLDPVLRMISGVDTGELMRKQCADLRCVQLMEMPATGFNKSGRPRSTRRCLSFCADFRQLDERKPTVREGP